MTEDTFAFVLHPLDPRRDASRKFPLLANVPSWLIEFISVFVPPVLLSEISGIRSYDHGRQARGWFIACPLSARMMMKLPTGVVYHKIIQSGKMAERLGARILGLGAFTSVVGDGGVTVAQRLRIPVTTGNSYTVSTAIQATYQAASQLGLEISEATVAVVGATGSIGSVCTHLMAPVAKKLVLIGRREEALRQISQKAREAGARHVQASTETEPVKQAQIVITVTSDPASVIESRQLCRGAIVCDVARPRDLARRVSEERPDVFVIEGGVVSVPGEVNFGFDFGFPPGMAYACMAETMALALDGRYESFTLGKKLDIGRVSEIEQIASRHGFQISGLRNLETVVPESTVAPGMDQQKQGMTSFVSQAHDRSPLPNVVH